MDAGRFDRWTRLYGGASRRDVLGGLVTGVLTGAFIGPKAARGREFCRKRGEDCTTASCCALPRFNLRCGKGLCKCKKGFADCDRNGRCGTNVLTDPDNCGRCGNRCLSGTCVNGACTCSESDHCPETCRCADRVGLGNGGVCARSTRCGSFPTCETDDDCPPRELCALCGTNRQCRGECRA